jgi:hypothetical protein
MRVLSHQAANWSRDICGERVKFRVISRMPALNVVIIFKHVLREFIMRMFGIMHGCVIVTCRPDLYFKETASLILFVQKGQRKYFEA